VPTLNLTKATWIYGGIGLSVVVLILLASFSGCNQIDFSNIKYGFKSFDITVKRDSRDSDREKSGFGAKGGKNASDPEELVDNTRPERQANAARANAFLEFAVRDYYNGNYDEALRRLNRAKEHNPANYTLFRLSGQIFFEQNLYRKAFNDWMRAMQLPNDDRSMGRDLDVVKRLIRYSRNEIDRLQRVINLHPGDRIAEAKLHELEQQMSE